jgi:hypothetical protein
MNALRPAAPAAICSSICSAVVAWTTPPQRAKSTTASGSASDRLRSKVAPSTVGGRAWGISTTVVTPPAAAPRPPASNPSCSSGSGSKRSESSWMKCVCASTTPGRTTRPVASISSAPLRSATPGAASSTTTPSAMTTSIGPVPAAVTTWPP